MRRDYNNGESNITGMLLSISAIFLAATFLKSLFLIAEGNLNINQMQWDQKQNCLAQITRRLEASVLIVLNSSTTFPIVFCAVPFFRQTLRTVLKKTMFRQRNDTSIQFS